MVPRPLAEQMLDLLASLTYWLDFRHRRIADINLRIAFPDLAAAQRHRLARKSFQIVARNLLEISRLDTLAPDNISTLVEYDPDNGLNKFEAARARGKPILYLTGHFSAWELLPTAHALHGYPLSFVTRPLDNPRIERYLLRIRQAAGNQVISKWDSARLVLEKLKALGSVGILIDQNTRVQEGTFADFFGVPAATTTSLALFALRTDATVLPGYLTAKKGTRYYIKFLPPLDLIRTGDKTRDIQVNTERFNKVVEDIIREQPQTWLWGHMRWKYQPHGNPQHIYDLSDRELEAFLVRVRRPVDPGERSGVASE
jgi:KDO2-lipid IV(A) lauroyltransferase